MYNILEIQTIMWTIKQIGRRRYFQPWKNNSRYQIFNSIVSDISEQDFIFSCFFSSIKLKSNFHRRCATLELWITFIVIAVSNVSKTCKPKMRSFNSKTSNVQRLNHSRGTVFNHCELGCWWSYHRRGKRWLNVSLSLDCSPLYGLTALRISKHAVFAGIYFEMFTPY